MKFFSLEKFLLFSTCQTHTICQRNEGNNYPKEIFQHIQQLIFLLICFCYTKKEIFEMMKDSGLTDIKFSKKTPYWVAIGIKN